MDSTRKYTRALDVADSKDVEGGLVKAMKFTKKPNQKWKVVYVDKSVKDATSGLNKDTGFHINRPFYFRSRLPMKRVAEVIGANNIVLKRWRKNTAA